MAQVNEVIWDVFNLLLLINWTRRWTSNAYFYCLVELLESFFARLNRHIMFTSQELGCSHGAVLD